MRWLGVLFLALACSVSARAEDWTTEDGKTYKNVTVLNQEADGVRITYEGGVGKIPYYQLPVDIQKRYGQDVDSLGAKKKAVDQAMDDAVRNAIAAEQMKQEGAAAPVVSRPGPAPSSNPSTQTPSPASANETTTSDGQNPSQNQTSPSTPSANSPNANTPAGTGQTPPQNQASSPSSTPTGNGASSAPANNGAAPSSKAPGTATAGAHNAPGAHVSPGGVADPNANALPSGLNDYTPGTGSTGVVETPYAGSKISYNQALDLSYLDSPAIDLTLVEKPGGKPRKQSQTASLTLRVISEGQKPAAPDRIEVTYLCVGGGNRSTSTSAIHFTVDGQGIDIADSARKDSSTMGSAGQALFYLTFYLSPDELKTISSGKEITVSVAPDSYRVNPNGMVILQAYQKDLDALPKPTASLIRSYYKLLAKIPSFVSMISTACEYLILGSFGILVCFSIAAFVMGITRFIKM